MNKKTKGEHLFIIILLCVISFSALCLAGCGGSCFGCSISCDKEEAEDAGCASGVSSLSDGCVTDDACIAVGACLDFEDENDTDAGIDNSFIESESVIVLSCESARSGCCGNSSCYNGVYMGSCMDCENYGCFFGDMEDGKIDDCSVGCFNGVAGCNDTDGDWHDLLEALYKWLGVGR